MGRHPNALRYAEANEDLIPQERQASRRVERALHLTAVACAESFRDGTVDAGEQRRIAAHLRQAMAGMDEVIGLDAEDAQNAERLIASLR